MPKNQSFRKFGWAATLFVAFTVAVSAPHGTHAQGQQEAFEEFARGLPQELLKQISRGEDRYLESVSRELFKLSPDGVVTKELVELAETRQKVGTRVKKLSLIIQHDLDGNGIVTSEEIELATPFLQTSQRSNLVLVHFEADENKDRDLSYNELIVYFDKKADSENIRRRRTSSGSLMHFDFNADGKVDLEEVSSVLAALSDDDLKSLTDRRARTRTPASCKAPKPSPGSQVVLLGGYEGPAVSTIAVGGRNQTTSVALITVEEGDVPLYVFASAYDPIIWKFDGATERISQVVIQPRVTRTGPGAAVAGIAADKVTLVDARSCIEKAYYKAGGQALRAKALLSAHLKTDIKYVVSSYSLDHIKIPSGNVDLEKTSKRRKAYRVPTEFTLGANKYELSTSGMRRADSAGEYSNHIPAARQTVRSMMRFYDGGLVPLSLEDITPKKGAELYDVLPQQAGLLQLMADGQLVLTPDQYYHVRKPIARYPAGLSGAHSVRFIVGKGIEPPAGSPGHSTVIMEETGVCISGVHCR